MQSFKAREKARRYAMQALYTWLISGSDVHEVEAFYLADRNPKNFDVPYFHRLLHDITANLEDVDTEIEKHIDRPFKDVDPIELNILRIATYELQHSFDVPFKVVIYEAVALAKTFGSDDSFKFTNKVLDKMASALRATEVLNKEHTSCKNATIPQSAN